MAQLHKEYMRYIATRKVADLGSRVALVTGANRGIGREICRQLAERGVGRVFLSSRDLEAATLAARELNSEVASSKAAGVRAGTIVPAQLDVTQIASVQAFATRISTECGGRLDILVNNAGACFDRDGRGNISFVQSNAETISQEELMASFELNVCAQVQVTQQMLPFLKKAPAARIVNMSSVLASLTMQHDTGLAPFKALGYAASKAALNMFTVCLASALEGTSIRVNSAHPGWAKTEGGGGDTGHPMQMGASEAAKTPVDLALLPDDAPWPHASFVHEGRTLLW